MIYFRSMSNIYILCYLILVLHDLLQVCHFHVIGQFGGTPLFSKLKYTN